VAAHRLTVESNIMESKLADALHLKCHPVALLWTDQQPVGAIRFHKEKWGCVMSMFAQAAAEGKTVAFDRDTFGCLGGGVGLGFGNQYQNWRGGIECFYGFLSTGNRGKAGADRIAEEIGHTGRKVAVERFLDGEGFVQSPELAEAFVHHLPIMDIPARYVVFKPLEAVDDDHEQPQVVIFVATPNQLSALVNLANFARPSSDNVIIPSCAGCQSIGIFPYREGRADKPRAVVGLTDIAARVYTGRTLGYDAFTFAVPFKLFLEIESNISDSFLEKETWSSLLRRS